MPRKRKPTARKSPSKKPTNKKLLWDAFVQRDWVPNDLAVLKLAIIEDDRKASNPGWITYQNLREEIIANAETGQVNPATKMMAGTVVVDESSGVERTYTFVTFRGDPASHWGLVDSRRLVNFSGRQQQSAIRSLADDMARLEKDEDAEAYRQANRAATCRVVCEDGEMCGKPAWSDNTVNGRLASNTPNVNDGGPLTVEVLYAHQEYVEDKELPSVCVAHVKQAIGGAAQWTRTWTRGLVTPENLNEERTSGLAGKPRNDNWKYHESLKDLVFVATIDSSYADATCTKCKTTGIEVSLLKMRSGDPVCPKCHPSDRWDNSASFDSPGDAYDALEAACSDAGNLVERLSEDEYLNGVGAPYERLGLNVSLRCLNETQDAEGNDTGVCNTVVSREPRKILDEGWACKVCRGSTSGQGADMFYRDRTSPASVHPEAVYVKSTIEAWPARGTNRIVVKPGIAGKGKSRCKVGSVDATVIVLPRWQAWCVEQMLIEYLKEIGGNLIDKNSPLPSAKWGRTETFYDPRGDMAEFARWAVSQITNFEELCDDYLEHHPNGGNNRTSDNAYVDAFIHELAVDYVEHLAETSDSGRPLDDDVYDEQNTFKAA